MFSLEMAKVLKDAGLEWEPKTGDLVAYDNGLRVTKPMLIEENDFEKLNPDSIWLPHLEQLLTEIDKRGYSWELSLDDVDVPPYAICLVMPTRNRKWFTADTPKETVAQALLWVLEKERQKMIRPNDFVKHIPSGEEWTVCGVNYSQNGLIPCGYPFPSLANISDCELIESRNLPQSKEMKDALIKHGLLSFIEQGRVEICENQ